MTETLIDRIARHEGYTQFPKPDAKGMDEIGYGHDITPLQAAGDYAGGISQPDAYTLLQADIDIATRLANGALPWLQLIDDVRQGVIVEMTFQLGIQGLLQFKHMLNAMQGDDWDAAAQAMLDSEWHSQTPQRCEELAGIMLTGEVS